MFAINIGFQAVTLFISLKRIFFLVLKTKHNVFRNIDYLSHPSVTGWKPTILSSNQLYSQTTNTATQDNINSVGEYNCWVAASNFKRSLFNSLKGIFF